MFHRRLPKGPESCEVAVDEVVVIQSAGIDFGVGGFHVLHDAEAQVDGIERQEGDQAGKERLSFAVIEADGMFQLLEDVLGSQVEPGVAFTVDPAGQGRIQGWTAEDIVISDEGLGIGRDEMDEFLRAPERDTAPQGSPPSR